MNTTEYNNDDLSSSMENSHLNYTEDLRYVVFTENEHYYFGGIDDEPKEYSSVYMVAFNEDDFIYDVSEKNSDILCSASQAQKFAEIVNGKVFRLEHSTIRVPATDF